MIGGEGLGDAMLLHNDEGDAIDERPRFVGASRIQIKSKLEEALGGRNVKGFR